MHTTLILNWIIWNRTVFCIKMDLVLNNLQRLICHKTQPSKQTRGTVHVFIPFIIFLLLLLLLFCKFFTPALAYGLSLESDWHYVDLNNALVWMVSARPPIYNSSCLLMKPLRTVPSASITFGITVILMLLSFFLVLWQGSSIFLSFYFIWFSLSGPPERQSSVLFFFFFFFFFY